MCAKTSFKVVIPSITRRAGGGGGGLIGIICSFVRFSSFVRMTSSEPLDLL